MIDAVKICFNKYAEFNGRAKQAEFWWFFLFTFVLPFVAGLVSPALSGLASLALLVPSLAVGARRLHDTNRSAWLLLLWLIPIVGWIVLLVFLTQDSKTPTASSTDAPA